MLFFEQIGLEREVLVLTNPNLTRATREKVALDALAQARLVGKFCSGPSRHQVEQSSR